MTRPSLRMSAAGLLLVAAVAACGGAAVTGTPAAATTTPTAGTAASQAATGTVSANTATADELIAALEGAGVANAQRWADEIQEYRPYPTDDPTLQTLRDNLAKYNPDAATLDAIMSVLEP